MPFPCHAPTMPFFSRSQQNTAVERWPCFAVALKRTAWSEHGMTSVNQTRPHCVNQMGKTHSKPLVSRHGRGTAWERHAMCESAFTVSYVTGCSSSPVPGKGNWWWCSKIHVADFFFFLHRLRLKDPQPLTELMYIHHQLWRGEKEPGLVAPLVSDCEAHHTTFPIPQYTWRRKPINSP